MLTSVLSFSELKCRELYWTATRLLGLAHLHDGSREAAQRKLEEEQHPRFGVLALKDESVDVDLAYLRLQAACSTPDCRSAESAMRPRLAYVSPLPPQKTGVAEYSVELILALSEYYDIDGIVENDSTVDAPEGCRSVRDASWFERHSHEYDHILYHAGNSLFHAYVFDLLEKIPGVVVLHDFFLGDALNAIRRRGRLAHGLYESHGYGALPRNPQETEAAVARYPANFFIFRNAETVVVHNRHARELAARFYGDAAAARCHVAHLARSPRPLQDRQSARDALDIPRSDFLVCSFGFLSRNKHNDRLIDAWAASSLARDRNARLVFVGENEDKIQREAFAELIAKRGLTNVAVTGFVTAAGYQAYLASADVAVQLRTGSRGETSGAALDCMSAGLATVVNAHGSMAELPDQGVIKLPEHFSDATLVEALEALHSDPDLRARVGAAGRIFLAESLSPERAAQRYHALLEESARKARPLWSPAYLRGAARNFRSLDEAARIAAARSLAGASPAPAPCRQLLVDISALARVDLRTGIQRVVRAQLLGLLEAPPEGFRIEPVMLAETEGRWRLRYARKATCAMLGLDPEILEDDVVRYNEGDIYFMPDSFNHGVVRAAAEGLYREMKSAGVKTAFTIYDILPIRHPLFFPEGAGKLHAEWLSAIAQVADRLICISESVKNDTQAWLRESRPEQHPRLSFVQLGADIEASAATQGLPDDAEEILGLLSQRPAFLMVGTIEPRKGHLPALAAFERLWARGVDATLVIVGAEGWTGLPDEARRTIPEIVTRLEASPERGRRLLWLNRATDEFLQMLYRKCVCLIAASDDEGFGLPLIEAARHDLPVLARDIPVFREVAGDHAEYFRGDADALAGAIENWLGACRHNSHRRSSGMQRLSWKENVRQTLQILLE